MGEVLTNTVCKVCGARYVSNLKACPHCGAVEKSDGRAVAWVDSFPVAIDKCPACSSPSIRRVGEIYRQSPAGAVLARQFAPPKKPSAAGRALGLFPLAAAFGSALVVFPGAVVLSAQELAPEKGQALPSWDIWLCFALAALGFGLGWAISLVATTKKRAELAEENKGDQDRWVAEMEVWERLYYCQSCEKVSDPLVGRSAHVYAMAALLDK